MGNETKRPATYADLEALPEHVVGQIVDGELIVMPRPANLHWAASGALHGELYGPFQRGRGGPGGWRLAVEPELRLSKDVLVPDLAGWRSERMPQVPDGAYVALAPDWVCEVISPSTASLDRGRKKDIYAREGVGYLWLVNPALRKLDVFERRNAEWVQRGTYSDEERVRAEPFEVVELELGALWRPELDAP